jgi:hypothetical protein
MDTLTKTRQQLDTLLDELIDASAGAMQDILIQLKSRPTFDEQWPDTYAQGLAKGRARVLQLESIRKSSTSMADILSARPAVLEWWNQHA